MEHHHVELLHLAHVVRQLVDEQPVLVLQGARDYNVTVADDYAVWQRGLAHRPGTTLKLYPHADHMFFNGSGRSTPSQDLVRAHVDPAVINDIASWIRANQHH